MSTLAETLANLHEIVGLMQIAVLATGLAVGILVGTAGGGWLFRTVGPSAPFVLFGFLNLVVFAWSLRVRRLPLVRPTGPVGSPAA